MQSRNVVFFPRIIKDHETHMKEMLKGGLEWFCTEKRGQGTYIAKLEGGYNAYKHCRN